MCVLLFFALSVVSCQLSVVSCQLSVVSDAMAEVFAVLVARQLRWIRFAGVWMREFVE
jgi:hypothetical protein